MDSGKQIAAARADVASVLIETLTAEAASRE
jgi:hypothetical protein